MDFLTLAKSRYSVRAFERTPIEEKKLQYILEAGRVAPTACNNQPQRIYVVRDATLQKKLSELCRYTFDAPVILVIAYDRERDWKNRRMPGYGSGETDAAIVCTHMMLAAWEQGIGSCWVGAFCASDIERVLELPENERVTAMLPLGLPAAEATPSERHTDYRDYAETITEK